MVLEQPRSPKYFDEENARTDWRRIRFGATLAIYGGAVGAFAVLVNLLSRAPAYDLQRLEFGPSIVFGLSGFLAGSQLAGPTAYWSYGGLGFFYPKLRQARGLLAWVFLGFAYGVVFPLLMGALFLPVTLVFVDFVQGLVSVPDLLYRMLALASGAWPTLAVTVGFKLFFSGFIAGGLFALGSWAIDYFNTSADPATAKYGAWAMALALSVLIIAVAAFGPLETLSKLG